MTTILVIKKTPNHIDVFDSTSLNSVCIKGMTLYVNEKSVISSQNLDLLCRLRDNILECLQNKNSTPIQVDLTSYDCEYGKFILEEERTKKKTLFDYIETHTNWTYWEVKVIEDLSVVKTSEKEENITVSNVIWEGCFYATETNCFSFLDYIRKKEKSYSLIDRLNLEAKQRIDREYLVSNNPRLKNTLTKKLKSLYDVYLSISVDFDSFQHNITTEVITSKKLEKEADREDSLYFCKHILIGGRLRCI